MIAHGNQWYKIYYFMKAVAIIRADIHNIGIKIILLFSWSVNINSVFAPDLVLKGRFIIKFINIFYQMCWEIGSGFKRPFFCSRYIYE